MKVEKKKTESGKIKAKLLILEARFYADMCDELAKGAIAALERRRQVPGLKTVDIGEDAILVRKAHFHSPR